jgi:hypothetical protein
MFRLPTRTALVRYLLILITSWGVTPDRRSEVRRGSHDPAETPDRRSLVCAARWFLGVPESCKVV